MKKQNIKAKKGFTIIEVVLVLAIAGLIFLMVFVALPALQRSQRDTQRRDDMARVATAVTQYQTNNNGKLPEAGKGASLITNYLGGTEFVDPDGSAYTINIKAFDGTTDTNNVPKNDFSAGDTGHQILFLLKAKCNGEVAAGSSNAREYAVLYKLEGSGVYCADNQ